MKTQNEKRNLPLNVICAIAFILSFLALYFAFFDPLNRNMKPSGSLSLIAALLAIIAFKNRNLAIVLMGIVAFAHILLYISNTPLPPFYR